jgi:hypothetical protein
MELDHLFVCTAVGALEAEALVKFGLREGPPNQHPGQGTSSCRFSFTNAKIELVWVNDPAEAQSPMTRRTLLWERWSGREESACPFGICLRPSGSPDTAAPFTAWEYRPAYLPAPLCLHIGEAGVEEPMWVYLSFMQRKQREQWFVEHPAGIREITGLTLTTPGLLRADASQKIIASGILNARTGTTSLLEVEFDKRRRGERVDFRPQLPMVFLM